MIKIEVYKGDITQLEVDAVVNRVLEALSNKLNAKLRD